MRKTEVIEKEDYKMKTRIKKETFVKRVREARAILMGLGLISPDGSGNIGIEWIMTFLSLLKDDRIKIVD